MLGESDAAKNDGTYMGEEWAFLEYATGKCTLPFTHSFPLSLSPSLFIFGERRKNTRKTPVDTIRLTHPPREKPRKIPVAKSAVSGAHSIALRSPKLQALCKA